VGMEAIPVYWENRIEQLNMEKGIGFLVLHLTERIVKTRI